MATVAERAAAGKAARSAAPRTSHADWAPPAGRDPIALLEAQATTRVPELVPIRHGRMAASPFAFFRGGALIMASDIAGGPTSGCRVQLCGDAHLSNFGGFAAPDRLMIFDVNDFDETLPGPWEWDVKRLAASVAVAGRERGMGRKARREIVAAAVGRYRTAMREFAAMNVLDVWYSRLDERRSAELARRATSGTAKRVAAAGAKARTKDSARAFAKLTHTVDGEPRIAAQPPLLVPVEDLLDEPMPPDEIETTMQSLIEAYRDTLPDARRRLLDRFTYVHLARKVVGVGSVGTRAWVVLMLGRDSGDPLFLQAKEAQASVLEPFAGASEYDNEGRRVVVGQQRMQAASDIFLGWVRGTGIDAVERDFYLRQLWDWKASIDVGTLGAGSMRQYATVCAWTLARAHARTGDAPAIAGYLGAKPTFDDAIAEFAERYADQNELDHAALLEAIESGRVAAVHGY
jgi:uncharacterized protein (DUF2252 family)